MTDAAFLHEVTLFRGLGQEEIAALAEALSEWECARGQAIFKEGDNADALYVVKGGEFEVLFDGGFATHHAPWRIKQGETFGEMALLDQKPRGAEVRALSRGQLLALSRDDFRRLGVEHPVVQRTLYRNIARLLAAKLRLGQAELRELAQRDKELLARLGDSYSI